MSNIKYLPIKDFMDLGLLQEVNRRFFHPMGLALEIRVEEDGSCSLGGIWDYRDDPEGMRFGDFSEKSLEKFNAVESMMESKRESREKLLGYFIQPIGIKDK